MEKQTDAPEVQEVCHVFQKVRTTPHSTILCMRLRKRSPHLNFYLARLKKTDADGKHSFKVSYFYYLTL